MGLPVPNALGFQRAREGCGTYVAFDALTGGDRPFPLVPLDVVLSASTYILLASVGQDVWVMSGTGGLPTGLRAPATDLRAAGLKVLSHLELEQRGRVR